MNNFDFQIQELKKIPIIPASITLVDSIKNQGDFYTFDQENKTYKELVASGKKSVNIGEPKLTYHTKNGEKYNVLVIHNKLSGKELSEWYIDLAKKAVDWVRFFKRKQYSKSDVLRNELQSFGFYPQNNVVLSRYNYRVMYGLFSGNNYNNFPILEIDDICLNLSNKQYEELKKEYV